jgi:hypothetical protein
VPIHADKLFQKTPLTPAAETSDQESVEDRGSYGVMRVMRDRATMIELRKKDGDIMAIPYAMIEKMRFNPNDGITIHALGNEIRIKGRHLNITDGTKLGLFNGLCRQRIAWVQENPRALGADHNTTLIESITW